MSSEGYMGTCNFYSHASCEARRFSYKDGVYSESFLLTRLLRGATTYVFKEPMKEDISTHTPLARRDCNT